MAGWAGLSPLYRISAMQRMSPVTVEAKTFNNILGFERGLWHRQTMWFAGVPKMRAFGKGRMHVSYSLFFLIALGSRLWRGQGFGGSLNESSQPI